MQMWVTAEDRNFGETLHSLSSEGRKVESKSFNLQGCGFDHQVTECLDLNCLTKFSAIASRVKSVGGCSHHNSGYGMPKHTEHKHIAAAPDKAPSQRMRTAILSLYFPASVLLGLHTGNVLAQIEGFQATDGGNSAQTQTGQHSVITSGIKGGRLGSGTVTSMNIHANESLTINQTSSSSHYLLKSTNVKADHIMGTLNSNGKVTLYSGNGLYFGKGARVNVNSLTASGMDIDVNDFLAGKLEFYNKNGKAAGIVVNQGLIEAATGGSVTLIGGAVKNEGVIMAHSGQVSMIAGEKVTMDFDGDGLIQFVIDKEVLQNAESLDSAVENTGTIDALGGTVLLSGKASSDVFSNVVNNSGVIKAGRIDKSGGKVRLVGLGTGNSVLNTGSIDVSSNTEGVAGGEIDITGDNITNSGTLTANSTYAFGGKITLESEDTTLVTEQAVVSATSEQAEGGEIVILGDKVGLFDEAVVDASGATGGGEVLIGGDYQGKNSEVKNSTETVVEEDIKIAADATEAGDGGKVIVWSDGDTDYSGHISAKGGEVSGDGGFAEVSGKQKLELAGLMGHFDLTAANGKGGTVLLDPNVINIVSTTEADPGLPNYTENGSSATDIEDADIEAFLDGGTSVTLTTTDDGGNDDDINMDAAASLTWDSTAILTLDADDDVNISGDITVTGGGGLTLITNDGDGSGGTVNILADSVIDLGTGTFTVNSAGGFDTARKDEGVSIDAAVGSITTNGASFISADMTFTGALTYVDTSTGTLSIDDNSTLTVGAASSITATNITIENTTDGGDGGDDAAIDATGQTLTITYTAAGDLDLGDANAGATRITQTELSSITASTLNLVTTGGNNIVVDNVAGADSNNIGTVVLRSDDNVTFSGDASTFNALTAQADFEANGTGQVSVAIGVTTDTAGIAISADDLVITDTLTSATDVTLSSTGADIEAGLGDANFGITDAEINNITANSGAGKLTIGESGSSSSITIDGNVNIDPNKVAELELISDSSISSTNSFDIISTAGSEGINSSDITVTATGTGTISLLGDINTSGVSGTSGAGSNGGNVNITTANGNITVGVINTSGGDAFGGSNANGGDAAAITITAGGASTITLDDSTISASGGALDGVGTDGNGATVTFNDAVTLDSSTNIDTTGETAGNIIFASTIDGAETLTANAGTGNITVSDDIGAGTALTALTLDGNDISIDDIGTGGAAGVTGTTAITAANDITFTGTNYNTNQATYTTAVSRFFNVNSASDTTFISSGDAIVFANGTIQLSDDINLEISSSGGDITVGNITGIDNEDLDLNAGSNSTLTVGTISAVEEVELRASGGSGVVVLTGDITTSDFASNDVTITGNVQLAGNITITTDNATNDGDITFDDAIDADDAENQDRSLVLNAGIGAVDVSSAAIGGSEALDGGVTITGGNITTAAITTSGTDAGANKAAGNITITGAGSVTTGDISAIGKGTGNGGNVDLDSDSDSSGSETLSVGAIAASDDGGGTNGGTILLNTTTGGTVNLGGDLTNGAGTAGNTITVGQDAVIAADVSISSGNNGGNITLQNVTGTSLDDLSIDSGTGSVAVGQIGTDAATDDINVVAISGDAGITLNGDIFTGDDGGTNGDVTFNDALVLGADISIDTSDTAGSGNGGDVLFSSTVQGTSSYSEDLTIIADTGAVTFNGAVGTTTELDNVDVQSSDSFTLDTGAATPGTSEATTTDTFVADSLRIRSEGLIDIGGDGDGDVAIRGDAGGNALDIESARTGDNPAIEFNASVIVDAGDILLNSTATDADIVVTTDGLTEQATTPAERRIEASSGDVTITVADGNAQTLLNDARTGGSPTDISAGTGSNTVVSGDVVTIDNLSTGTNLADSTFVQVSASTIGVVFDGNLALGDDATIPLAFTHELDDTQMTGLLAGGATSLSLTANAAGGDNGDIVLDRATTFGSNNLELIAAGFISDNSDGVALDTSGTLTLTAGAGIGIDNPASNNGGSLTIDVNNLITINDAAGSAVNITNNASAGDATYEIDSAGTGSITDITIQQDANDLLINEINASGTVALNTPAAIVDNSDADIDITATSVQLVAGTGIADGDELSINAADATNGLAATTASGEINILDVEGGLSIGAITSDFDDAGATTTTTTGVSVTAGGAGDVITIRTTETTADSANGITVNQAVSNTGGGAISIIADGDDAGDSITVNNTISASSGDGNIELIAGDSISITGVNSVTAEGTGAISVFASEDFVEGSANTNGVAGAQVTMQDGTTISSQDGDISIQAGNNIFLSTVNANSDADGDIGNVTITADYDGVAGGLSNGAGDVRDNLTAETANLIGDTINISSSTGIGTADDIEVTVATQLNADTSAGNTDIQLTSTGDMPVGLITAGTGNVTLVSGGAINSSTDDGVADIVGDIVDLTAAVGGIGTTTILDITAVDLRADTDAGDDANIIIDGISSIGIGAVTAGAGNVTIDSTGTIDGVTDDGVADISAATVNLLAAVGGIGNGTVLDVTASTELNADTVTGDDANIQIDSIGDVTVGLISAGTGNVTLDSTGDIDSSNDDGTADIVGAAVTLLAASGGIGNTSILEVTSSSLNADTDAGDDANIVIDSIGDLNVGLIDAGAGDVTLVSTGDIDSVSDDGAADIIAATINLTAAVGGIGTSVGDALDITATTALNADTNAGDDADIFIDSIGGLPLGLIDAGAGNVTLDSTGNITDAGNDTVLDINAVNVDLTAAGAIGSAGNGAIDTTISDLNASATSAGSIFIAESDGITLSDVDTSNGAITVTAAGAVAVVDVQSSNNNDANDITITTTTGDIDVTLIDVGGALGDVTLDTDNGAVDGVGAGTHITGDTLDIDATTGIGASVALNLAEVDTLTADTTTGNIDINNDADNIVDVTMTTNGGSIDYDHTKTLGGPDAQLVLTSVTTNDGDITITNTGTTSSHTLIRDGAVSADTADDIVSITTSGEIRDASTGDATEDITAFSIDLDAGAGIGVTTGTLEVAASLLDADVSGTGDIDISETDAVTLTSLSTNNGAITIQSGGAMTVTSVISSTDNDANDVSLTATTGNIEIDSIVTGTTSADVFMTASSGAVVDRLADTSLDITTEILTIDATAGVGSANALETSAAGFDIDNTVSGNIDIDNNFTTADVTVTKLAIAAGTGTIDFDNTGNRALTVTSATTNDGNITITNTGDANTDTLTASTMTAGGSGDIQLTTTTRGDISITVNLTATGDTITVDSSDDITLGNTIDISTGGAGQVNLNVDVNNDVAAILDLGTDSDITSADINFAGNATGNDTLAAQDEVNTWVLTGSGTLDNGNLTSTAVWTDFVIIEGGNNTDTVDQTNASAPDNAIAVVLSSEGMQDGMAGSISGTGITTTTFDNIDEIFTDQTGNTITGAPSAAIADATWTIDGGNENYTDDASGQDLDFSGSTFFTTLTGGSGNDTFNVTESYTGDLEGGEGTNTYLFNSTVAKALTGNITGGSGSDRIIFGDDTDLDPDAVSDDNNLYTIIGNIDGGAGTDTLDYLDSTLAQRVKLQDTSITDVDGSEGIITDIVDFVIGGAEIDLIEGEFNNIDNLIGNSKGTYLGPNATTFWEINDTDAGSHGTSLGTIGTTTFSNQNVVAGSGDDTFTFTETGIITLGIDGGAGTNTLVGSTSENTFDITNTDPGESVDITVDVGGADLMTSLVNITNIDRSVLSDTQNDTFNIDNDWNGTINGGDGNNSFNLAEDVSVGSIIGGSGTDTLNAANDNTANTVLITGGDSTDGNDGSFTDITTSSITSAFTGIENIDIGNGADIINVQAMRKTLTINAGDGNDTFNVSSDAPTNTGDLTGIRGVLTVRGNAGTDTLIASDLSDTVNEGGSINGTDITGILGAGGSINYSDGATDHIENVTVELNSEGGNFFLERTDTFNSDSVTISGNGNATLSDVLRIDDQTEGDNTTYTFTSSQFTTDGTATVFNYDTIEEIELRTGTGDDTINASGWASEGGLISDAGGSNDVFEVTGAFGNSTANYQIVNVETIQDSAGMNTLTAATLRISGATSGIGTIANTFNSSIGDMELLNIGDTFIDNTSALTIDFVADTNNDFSLDNNGEALVIERIDTGSSADTELLNVGNVSQTGRVDTQNLYVQSVGSVDLSNTSNVVTDNLMGTTNGGDFSFYNGNNGTDIEQFTGPRGSLTSTTFDTNGGDITFEEVGGAFIEIINSIDSGGGDITFVGGFTNSGAGNINAGSGDLIFAGSTIRDATNSGAGVITANSVSGSLGSFDLDNLTTNSIELTDNLAGGNNVIRSIASGGSTLTINGIDASNGSSVEVYHDGGNIAIAGDVSTGASILRLETENSGNINKTGDFTLSTTGANKLTLVAAGGIGLSGGAVNTSVDYAGGGTLDIITNGGGSAGNASINEANSFNTNDLTLTSAASNQTFTFASGGTININESAAGTTGLNAGDSLVLSSTFTTDTGAIGGTIDTNDINLRLNGNLSHTGINEVDTGSANFIVDGNLTGTDNIQVTANNFGISGNLEGADINLTTTNTNFFGNTIVQSSSNVINLNNVTGSGALQIRTNAVDDVINIATTTTADPNILDIKADEFSGFSGELIIGGFVNNPAPNVLENNTEAGDITVDASLIDIQNNFNVGTGNLTLLADSINIEGSSSINAGDELIMVAQGSDPAANSNDGDITFGGAGGTPNIIDAGNTILVAENTVNNLSGARFVGDTISVSVDADQAENVEDPAAGTTASPADPSAAILAAINNALGFAVAAVDITVPNPASALIGLQEIAFIDVGLFEEELTLFGIIGNGIALSLAQCEEVEGCAPNVTEEELNELIAALEARIDELNLRLADATDAVAIAELEALIAGFEQELNNYRNYLADLKDFLEGGEEEEFAEDFEEDFETDFDTDFSEELPTAPADVATVESYGEMLETVNNRIEWLESLKSNPEERARLSKQTGIDLTLENLEMIIEASRQEAGFIENQIKLLLEGTEALLPKESPQYSHRKVDKNLAVNITEQILPINGRIGFTGVYQWQ